MIKENKMPKLKTKSGAKKRFSLTASGKVKGSPAFLSHNLRKRSPKNETSSSWNNDTTGL